MFTYEYTYVRMYEYMMFCAAKAYKNHQKNARQVLFFFCLHINKFKRDDFYNTRSAKWFFFLENALKKTTEYFQISFFIGKYNPFG